MQKSHERLAEIDKEISALEIKLFTLFEERRETINYLNLNKDNSYDPNKPKETIS